MTQQARPKKDVNQTVYNIHTSKGSAGTLAELKLLVALPRFSYFRALLLPPLLFICRDLLTLTGGIIMQDLLRDSMVFCWNITLILFLTLLTALAVTPLSGSTLMIFCYLTGLWSACFIYAIFVTGWSRSTCDVAAPQDQTIFLSDLSQINSERNRHRLAVAIQQTIEEFMKEEFIKEAA